MANLADQLGDFAEMMRPKPPKSMRLLLEPAEIVALIVEALMMTADRINAGLPVDSTRSIAAAKRSNNHQK